MVIWECLRCDREFKTSATRSNVHCPFCGAAENDEHIDGMDVLEVLSSNTEEERNDRDERRLP